MNLAAASKTLERYGITPDGIDLVQSRPDRTVWRVTAGTETYALKWMERARSAHRVEALSAYLLRSGIRVPPVLPTLDGAPALDGRKGRFLLFPWIPSRNPRYDEDPGMLERMVTLLARFHGATEGYVAEGGPFSRHPLDWRQHYGAHLEHLLACGRRAVWENDPFSRTFRNGFPWLYARAARALDWLSGDTFRALVETASNDPVLGHGDFSRVNLLLDSQGELILIDLDSVGAAVPISDLSRLMLLVDHDLQGWSPERFEQMLRAYHRVRPVSRLEREYLLVDQLFPFQAVNLARSFYLKEWGEAAATLPEELERCLATDQAKLAVLGVRAQ